MHAVAACGGGTPLASGPPPLLEPDPELRPVSAPPSAGAPVEPPHADHESMAGTASSDRIASARREGAAVSMRRASIVTVSVPRRHLAAETVSQLR